MKLRKSVFHLLIWQGSTYLIPLIVTPYLARMLGVNAFGTYGLSLAFAMYGMLLTDWGFNLSAAQKTARAHDDHDTLRTIFWNVMTARMLLACAAAILLVIATITVPMLRAIWPVVLAASTIVLSTALSANFFLQGLQYMGAFAVSALIGRLLIIPLTFAFVHRPEDVVIAVLIQNATQLISAIASIVIASKRVKLGRPRFDLDGALLEIREGWHLFVSTFSVSFYTHANAVVVGFASGHTQAGILTASQRVGQAFQQLIQPLNMAVYPQVNRLSEADPRAAVRLMKRVLVGQSAIVFLISLTMFLSAPYLVPIFLGRAFASAVPVVQVLSVMPFLAGLTNILGGNMLLPLGLRGPYMTGLALSGMVNIALLLILAPARGAMGAAISASTTELFLAGFDAVVLYQNRGLIVRMMAGENPSKMNAAPEAAEAFESDYAVNAL